MIFKKENIRQFKTNKGKPLVSVTKLQGNFSGNIKMSSVSQFKLCINMLYPVVFHKTRMFYLTGSSTNRYVVIQTLLLMFLDFKLS